MPLSDTAIRNAKPRERLYKLADEKGLYLEVTPTGGKWWRWKYRFAGKEKRLSMGTYPETSLKEARNRRDEARRLLAQGVDPSEHRKAMKASQSADAESFEAIAREWYGKQARCWSEGHKGRVLDRLEKDIFPWLGARSMAAIKPPDLLAALRRIEARGAIETAHKVKQICGQVFRYGVATGRCERDPAADLKGALSPVKVKHHASITDPQAIGDLLRAIGGYQGSFVVKSAMQLAPLVFTRPGELRAAEWSEIDLDKSEWRIPAAKMKMRDQHIVPLSTQAVAILQEIKPLTGRGRYVFPSARTPNGDRCLSENAVLAALRRLGYSKDEMTGHGFRSMASTLLNEQGWHRDAIERQLAHAERDNVRAAYNYAEHLPERRRMMQAWSDYLDGLWSGATVLPFKKNAG